MKKKTGDTPSATLASVEKVAHAFYFWIWFCV